MTSDQRIRNRRSFRNPMLVFGIAMVLFYYCFGIFLLISPETFTNVPAEFLRLFSAMLLIYGTYRGWRIYQDYFKRSE